MGRIDGDSGGDGLDDGETDRVIRRYFLHSPENEWMMCDYHVRPAFHCLIHQFRCTVKAYQHTVDGGFRRADQQSAVIPFFLDTKRGKVLYYPRYIIDNHSNIYLQTLNFNASDAPPDRL